MKGKKDFTGGLSSLLGETTRFAQTIPSPEATQTSKPAKEISKTSQIGTKDDETRATFIVKEDALEKIKAIAYWDRLQIKDVIALALDTYLSNYEKEAGPIKPIPTK